MKEYRHHQIKKAFDIYKKHSFNLKYRWDIYWRMEEYSSKRIHKKLKQFLAAI